MKIFSKLLNPYFSNLTTNTSQDNQQFTDYLNYLMCSSLENKKLFEEIVGDNFLNVGLVKRSNPPTLGSLAKKKYKLTIEQSQYIIFLYVKTKIENSYKIEQIPWDMEALAKWIRTVSCLRIYLNNKCLELSKIENDNLIFRGSTKTQESCSIKLSTMNKYSRRAHNELIISSIFGKCNIAPNRINTNKTNQCTALANLFNETMTDYHFAGEDERGEIKKEWAKNMETSLKNEELIEKYNHRHLWKNINFLRARNFYFLHTNMQALLDDILAFCESGGFKNFINSTATPEKKFIVIPVTCFTHETTIVVSESSKSTPKEPIYKLRYYNPNNGVWLNQYLYTSKPNNAIEFKKRFELDIASLETIQAHNLTEVLMSAQYYLYIGNCNKKITFNYTSNYHDIPNLKPDNDPAVQYLYEGIGTDDLLLVKHGLSAPLGNNSNYFSQPPIYNAIQYRCNDDILDAILKATQQQINNCNRGEKLSPATPLKIAMDIAGEVYKADRNLDLSNIEFLLKNGANINGCNHGEHNISAPLSAALNKSNKNKIVALANNYV